MKFVHIGITKEDSVSSDWNTISALKVSIVVSKDLITGTYGDRK